MIGNIKETFLQKTGIQKKQILQDPRYVDTAKACCMLHATMQGAFLRLLLYMLALLLHTIESQCRF